MSKPGERDYSRNRGASEDLADKLRQWWHSRGHTSVKVWVEESNPVSEFGTKLPPIYEIKTNIIQDVDQLLKGNVVK